MNRLLNILKYLFLSILTLIILVAAGLLLYYQAIYRPTPLPAKVSALPPIDKPSIAAGTPVLLPVPQQVEWTSGHFALPATLRFEAPDENPELLKKICRNRLQAEGVPGTNGILKCQKTPGLAPQAYRLTILPARILVEYGETPGLFYALTTVKQLAQQSGNLLPCGHIEDQPDLATRGAMVDISRGKIPTLETLYGLVDFLSDLKYNQLQLYIEGFSFAYPSFKNLWEKQGTPLTPAEIQQLDAYCKDRFIELVPNQNALGHMQDWLKTDEFKDLAECPEGYKLLGLIDMKTTLSPTNPKSLELVQRMSEDLLPNFSSGQFNVNLDEPFELGKSKTRPIDDPRQIARLYMDYAKQLNAYVNSKGKSMMMWGDVVARSPEIIPEIPRNITLLEWRYEAMQPFEKICAEYQAAGLRYMVCPGTSSWSSFTGRTDNMLGNIENAVGSAVRHGAAGMLITDWGDTPHLQYLPVSYPGLAYGAALSWHDIGRNEVPLGAYLSRAVFRDSAGIMGDLVLETGRYNQFEEYPMLAMTTTSLAYMFGILDKTMLDAINQKMQHGIQDLLPNDPEFEAKLTGMFNNPRVYNAQAIAGFVDQQEQNLLLTRLHCPDSALIRAEYQNAFRMIRLGAQLKQYNNYHLQQTDAENKALLTGMQAGCTAILSEHEHLWMHRNKPVGYATSTQHFEKLQQQISERLKQLDQNAVSRWAGRALEKMTAAALALYMKN